MIDLSLRFLKLPSMDELTSKYFEKFGENVEFLDISGLRIKKLPSFIFENLLKLKWLDLRSLFLAPTRAQGVTLSVRPSGTRLSRAVNLYL